LNILVYCINIDSGKGVFLSCKQRRFILPGTLLGFYPGLVFPSILKSPKIEVNSTLPFLKRYDGMWLDPYYYIPYPMKPLQSIDDFFTDENISKEVI
jgi:hypothetical protein